MKVLELMKALGGEVLANKARATVGGKVVIIGRMIDGEWQITDEGSALAAEANKAVKVEEPVAEKPVKRTSKTNTRKAD